MVSTRLKNMLVKLASFPRDRGEHEKYLTPPPRFFVTPGNVVLRSAWRNLGYKVRDVSFIPGLVT